MIFDYSADPMLYRYMVITIYDIDSDGKLLIQWKVI